MFNLEKIVFFLNKFSQSLIPKESYVFDKKTDLTIKYMGKIAREHLENYPLSDRKKIVFFLGYHHSKFLALNDAVLILALQLRGAEVIPIVSSYFYQKEDVIYGGVYNSNRFDKQYKYAVDEIKLVGEMLNANPVSITAFSDKLTELEAKKFANSVSFLNWKDLKFKEFEIGKMAHMLVCNMNNIPTMRDTESHIDQLRWHVYNIVRLISASQNLLNALSPDAIVSNIPFYYRWFVPFVIARFNEVPFYSYVLGERRNTLAWSSDTNKLFDSSPAWEAFRSSNIYENYADMIDKSIEDRVRGNTSHIRFLPEKNLNHNRIHEIKTRIRGRASVLFPVNVLVDAVAFAPTLSFNSCMDMVTSVVAYFDMHPEFVCLIKAHPAESVWKNTGADVSSMHLRSAIIDAGLQLPENVVFIDYDEQMSSFNLYELVHGLIAYSSSACMEISWYGKRIISAHDSHYCCAGFAYHPKSKNEFFQQLEFLLLSDMNELKSEVTKLGRIYYLFYYYICQIDYKLIEGNDLETIPPKLLFDNIDHLLPGKNAALDYVCDSILMAEPIFSNNRWPPITV